MPMPATGLLQLYLWQGRMRVENLPAYIRRQMSRHPALTAALTPRLGACPGQTILVLRSADCGRGARDHLLTLFDFDRQLG